MLLKKAVDWNDLDIKREGMNRKDKFVLFCVALFLIVAVGGLFYIVKHWYEN